LRWSGGERKKWLRRQRRRTQCSRLMGVRRWSAHLHLDESTLDRYGKESKKPPLKQYTGMPRRRHMRVRNLPAHLHLNEKHPETHDVPLPHLTTTHSHHRPPNTSHLTPSHFLPNISHLIPNPLIPTHLKYKCWRRIDHTFVNTAEDASMTTLLAPPTGGITLHRESLAASRGGTGCSGFGWVGLWERLPSILFAGLVDLRSILSRVRYRWEKGLGWSFWFGEAEVRV
jgi:hypothetical protein